MPEIVAPIIIKKKKGGHGGHHGGAWKVAYADFVTAMMSLFIVLWLMSSTTKQEQQVIAGYFRDPNGRAAVKGSDRNGTGENILLKKQDMTKLKEVLQQQVHHVDNLDKLKKQIEMTITPEGLRIELMEDAHGTFFETGSSQPTPILLAILKILSQQIGSLPNRISIEGHTDAQPYSNDKVYSNWELSSDRANMTRRVMQANGIRANQVAQVRGFADQHLRDKDHPLDAANRRISLIVQYLDGDKDAPMAPLVAAKGAASGESEGAAKPGAVKTTSSADKSPAAPSETPAKTSTK